MRKLIEGIDASPGVVVGKAFLYKETELVINKSKIEGFDDLLIGAKQKLSLAEIEFYQDCAARESMSFTEWMNKKDEI